MPVTNYTKTLISNTRVDIRNEVTSWFLQEIPGTGKGSLSSKSIYLVESYNGYGIELRRPAALNKGFDFTVCVNGMMFKGKKRHHPNPSHNNIFVALKYCQNQNESHYNNVIKPILNNLYNCANVVFGPNSLGSFIESSGVAWPIEIILMCVKWLLIEQDMTYWNWSGREMLFNGLKSLNLI